MALIILMAREGGRLTVCIEKQQSMPGQGVSSTFSTGYGFGLWIGILDHLVLEAGLRVLSYRHVRDSLLPAHYQNQSPVIA